MDVDAFVRDGYVAMRGAVGADTVAACRELTWAAMARRGIRRDDPASWPAVAQGFGDLTGEPFAAAHMAPALTAAYDELIGPGRWNRSVDIGEAVVVRFPKEHDRGNAGYHIEGSYAGPDGTGWVNIRSRARGLLALFLLTDAGPDDAPTRLMRGSHLYVPEFLAPHGEAGADSDGAFWRESVLCLADAHATGRAGDVFLCHPFIVHTATWPHRGTGPRIIARRPSTRRRGSCWTAPTPPPWPGPSSAGWSWRGPADRACRPGLPTGPADRAGGHRPGWSQDRARRSRGCGVAADGARIRPSGRTDGDGSGAPRWAACTRPCIRRWMPW